MKSIKPGRGPSGISFIGSVIACVFGVIWIVAAVGMGAPWFFPLFGVCFVGLGIVQAVYNYHNATGENRYSSFDIVEDGEEPDPLMPHAGGTPARPAEESGFCPWCGAPVAAGHKYCRRCGKEL